MDTFEPIRFEVFFREQHGPLFRAMCLITGNRHEAEEIAQDAFLKIWERWDRVALMERPDGYLFRTAMNVFRKRLRKPDLATRLLSTRRVSDDLADVEHRDASIRALRTLTPQQRAALVLSGLFDYTTAEIGDMLGCQASTVRVHLSRARAAVRAQDDETRP